MSARKLTIEFSVKCEECGQFVNGSTTSHCGQPTKQGYFDDDGTEYSMDEYMALQEAREYYDQPEYNPEEYL